MTMRTAGIQLIAKGAKAFINDLNKASQAEDKLLKATIATAEKMTASLDKQKTAVKNSEIAVTAAYKNEQQAIQTLADRVAQWNAVAASATATAYEVARAENLAQIATWALVVAEERLAVAEAKATALNVEYAESLVATAAASTEAAAASAALAAKSSSGGLFAKLGSAGGPLGTIAGMVLGMAVAEVQTKGLTGALADLGKALLNGLLRATGLQAGINAVKWEFGLFVGVVNLVKNAVVTAIGIFEKLVSTLFRVATTLSGIVVGAIKGVIGAIGGLADKLISPFVNFGKQVLAIFSGISLWNFIQKGTQAFQEFTSGIKDALSLLQQYDIQLQALAARDIANLTGVPFTQAMKMAIPIAKELFDWVRNLAVVTPFTVVDITQTVAMANAMGMNVEQSKRLTHAIGNFASGMGLTADHMYRIVYNMGQMVSMGKLTGREFRDLANSFVPVYQILDEMRKGTGKTREEFRKFAMEGGVEVNAFIEKFIEVSEKNFPNAMQRMARTWEGVQNNIKDFLQVVLGFEVFGPTFDRVTSMMADALDKLLSPAVRDVADRIGNVLLVAFNKLVEVWQSQVIPALQSLAIALGLPDWSKLDITQVITNLSAGLVAGIQRIAQFISDISKTFSINWSNIATDAFTWGSHIIKSFAQGMVNALVEVANAIAAIVNYIASMLRAFSPPKALPDLTKWGAAAVAAYMEGWKQIDYKLFADMASTIEGYLRSLGKNVVPEKKLVPIIQGMRSAVAGLVEQIRATGNATQDMIDNVMNASKYLPSNFETFIRALINVEKATYAVKKAQEAVKEGQATLKTRQDALNKTTERYDKILDDLNKQLERNQDIFDENHRLQEINAAIATGLLTAEEQARLEVEKRDILLKQQIRTVEDQRDAEVSAQQAQIDEAQAALDLLEVQEEAAKAKLDIANEELEAQKSLIGIQSDNAKLIQEQIDLLERLAKAAKDAGGAAVAAAEDTVDAAGLAEDALRNLEHRGYMWKLKNFGLPTDEPVRAAQNFKTAFAEAQKNIDTFISNLQANFENAKGNIKGLFDPLIGPGGAIAMVKWSFENLERAIFGGFTGGPGGEPIKTVGVIEKIKSAGKGISEAWAPAGKTIGEIKQHFEDIAVAISKIIFPDSLLKALDTIKTTLDIPKVNGAPDIFGFITNLVTFQLKVLEMITGMGAEIMKIMTSWSSWSVGGFPFLLKGLIELMMVPFQGFYDFLVGKSLIPDLGDEINDIFDDKLTTVATTIGTHVDEMVKVFTDHESEFYTAGVNEINKLSDGMDNTVNGEGGLLSKIDGFIVAIMRVFYLPQNVQLFYDIGVSIVNGITAGLGDQKAWSALYNAIIKIVRDAIAAAKREASTASPSKKTMKIGRDMGMGLALGIQKSANMVSAAISNAVNSANVRAASMGSNIVGGQSVPASSITNATSIDRSVHIEVNPSYKNYQSSAGVYYDVVAALAAAGR